MRAVYDNPKQFFLRFKMGMQTAFAQLRRLRDGVYAASIVTFFGKTLGVRVDYSILFCRPGKIFLLISVLIMVSAKIERKNF